MEGCQCVCLVFHLFSISRHHYDESVCVHSKWMRSRCFFFHFVSLLFALWTTFFCYPIGVWWEKRLIFVLSRRIHFCSAEHMLCVYAWFGKLSHETYTMHSEVSMSDARDDAFTNANHFLRSCLPFVCSFFCSIVLLSDFVSYGFVSIHYFPVRPSMNIFCKHKRATFSPEKATTATTTTSNKMKKKSCYL